MEQKYTLHIKSKSGLFDINYKELLEYKDLIWLYVKKDFSVMYKQTILGPLWFLINPLFTTFIYTFIFGNVAGLSTEGIPHFIFYLVSYAIWSYFATCITDTANTFVANAAVFGKVYFPRLVLPISTVIFSLVNFMVIMSLAIITMVVYTINGTDFSIGISLLIIPILVIQTALLGLGFGIIVSSLTTKYRDLSLLVSFGVQLWMYVTPVVYPMSQFSDEIRKIIMLNPMAPIVNNFRFALLGCGTFEIKYWVISIITTGIVLAVGVILFNKVEKSFMDTV